MRRTIIVMALIAVVGAPPAAASTGQFTNASANETWIRGSIAGSVTWDQCGSPCSWLPAVTVQPASPDYYCRGDEPIDSDPNTQFVWGGGNRTTNETVPFDLADVPLLSGVHGQRACLVVIATTQIRDPVCVAQYPILGLDPSTCPFVNRITGHPVANALLTVPPLPAPTPPPTTTAPPSDPMPPVDVLEVQSPSPATQPPLTRRQKRARAMKHCAVKRTKAKRAACRKAVTKRYGPSSRSS